VVISVRCEDQLPFRNKQEEDFPFLSSHFPFRGLLGALDDSKIGIVVCDRLLRYTALNQALAEMHNVPIGGHLGHSCHQILGGLADQVVPSWENVLATGRPVCKLEIKGQLPNRSGEGRWIENLFPLADVRGRITRVGCIVIEASPSAPPTPYPSGPASDMISVTNDGHSSQDRTQQTALSRREREVLRLLAEGKCNKEISSVLAISVRTVETYRSRLMLKLQASSSAHLIHQAIKNRILTP
jgi:DNA-binding CsgD family transcriptional regulator